MDINIEELIDNPEDYEKVTDTLDVWFDSGSSHAAVLEKKHELEFPADLYLEGSDQHRGWFQSSLLTSVAINDSVPYKSAMTHGFTVDAKGNKMSKSKGNVIAPQKIIDSFGSDIFRLWVASTDCSSEMNVSEEILNRTSDKYRKIRNTFRYLLGNIKDNFEEVDFKKVDLNELTDIKFSVCQKFMMRLEADKVDVSFYRDQSLQRNIPLTAGVGSTEVDRNSIEDLEMAKLQLGSAANDYVQAIKEVCEKIDLPSNNFVNEPWPSHLYFEDLNGESEFSLVELILKQVYDCPKIVRAPS